MKNKCKATTMVLVENTSSYQGYYRVKSIVWISFMKLIVFYKKKTNSNDQTEALWATKKPLL